MLLCTFTTTTAETLPKDKAAKSYFKRLQTQRVESSDFVEWHQVSPGSSGYCETFWTHPTDPKTLIMAPDMFNTFGSWDGGESWTTIKDFDAGSQEAALMGRIMSLAFSPTNPDLGITMSQQGYAMRTTDRGRSWERACEMKLGKCSAVAVDPTNEKIWYAAPGDFWNVKKNHRNAKTLADPSLGKDKAGYIYKSTDGGGSWTKITAGLPNNIEVGRIIVNPANTKEIFLASNHGVYKSVNGGNKWEASFDGIPNCIIRDLDSHYDKKSGRFTLFALDQTAYYPDGKSIRSEGGVFRSDDSAKTWVDITGNLAIDMSKIAVRPYRSFLYNRTVSHWLGINSKVLNQKYPEPPINILSVFNRLRVSPLNPDEIYVSNNPKHDFGFSPGEVWKSNDGGKSWFATARSGQYWSSETDKEYWESRNNPMTPNEKFAHLQPHIDRGISTFGNRFMEFDSKGTLYTGFEQQLMRSTDGGKTWEQRDDVETAEGSKAWVGRGGSNLPGRQILLETGVAGRYLFCSGEHGLWMTAPLGSYPDKKAVAITQIEGQVNEHGAVSHAAVAVDPKNPDIIYTLQFRQDHRGYFRCSKDGGRTWANLSEPLPWSKTAVSGDRIFQSSLMVDPEDTQRIYFTTIQNDQFAVPGGNFDYKSFPFFGISRSKDGGKTWELANKGLPEVCSVGRLEMDPKNPKVLYAALSPSKEKHVGGLYKSTDGADSWSKVNIPEGIISVNNVHQDPTNHMLYISCGTTDGSLETGGVWRSKDEGKTWEKFFYMPYIWQCETSPIDPDIITVVVAGQKKSSDVNCGAYISVDGGKNWEKVNRNIGLQHTITDLKPDPVDKKKLWMATKGSGWAVGYMK